MPIHLVIKIETKKHYPHYVLYLGFQVSKGNLDNFFVPVNAPFDRKCSLSNQTISERQANSGLSHPNQIDYVAPANQIFSIFLLLVLYSLSYKSFLPSIPFCSSLKGDCPLHEVRNKVCFCPLNCLL